MKKISVFIKQFFTSKAFKIIGGLGGCLVIFVLIFGVSFNTLCSSAQRDFLPVNDSIPEHIQRAAAGIEKYKRSEESTYLTYPEWYLVFNPQEYGQFIETKNPSDFPYFTSIRQFWGGYCEVYGITKNNYPFNSDDHLMEVVIGTSFSAEFAVKGIWENTIGRVSEWIGGSQTPEDVYAAKIAQEYGAFIPTVPWFEFPFGQKFIGLWKETDFFGPSMTRKLERKVFLSLEYGVKAGYAYLIGLGSHAVYGIADTEIYISATNVPESVFDDVRFKKIKDLGDGTYIMTIPHYQGFTDTVPLLVEQGVQFIDIAGNNEIFMTAVAPSDWNYTLSKGKLLFTMKMLNSDSKRIAVQVPVKDLSVMLSTLLKEGVVLEHLYDF